MVVIVEHYKIRDRFECTIKMFSFLDCFSTLQGRKWNRIRKFYYWRQSWALFQLSVAFHRDQHCNKFGGIVRKHNRWNRAVWKYGWLCDMLMSYITRFCNGVMLRYGAGNTGCRFCQVYIARYFSQTNVCNGHAAGGDSCLYRIQTEWICNISVQKKTVLSPSILFLLGWRLAFAINVLTRWSYQCNTMYGCKASELDSSRTYVNQYARQQSNHELYIIWTSVSSKSINGFQRFGYSVLGEFIEGFCLRHCRYHVLLYHTRMRS